MACISALPRTQFLGATISSFTGSIGWNGQQGELTCDLVNDTCVGGGIAYADDGNGEVSVSTGPDNFDPPVLGSPVTFRYGGFSFSGILQNWKEIDSGAGALLYRVRIIDPKTIIDGTQLILNAYNGNILGLPNLNNVFGWLEQNQGFFCAEFGTFGFYPPQGMGAVLSYLPASGFGGADPALAGLPFGQIKQALSYLLNLTDSSQDTFGGPCQYRNHFYRVDISDLPALDYWIRFGDDSMSLSSLIHQVCEYASFDYFYTLENHNTIKVNTVDRSWQSFDLSAFNIDTAVNTPIANRLDQGTIGGAIGSGAGFVDKNRGVELREAFTNSFLTGEYRQDIWQTDLATDGTANSTIWPYWGEDKNGNVILGTGIATTDLSSDHSFTVDMSFWDVGLIGTWTITTVEMRMALAGRTQWQDYVVARQPELVQLGFISENEFPEDDDEDDGQGGRRKRDYLRRKMLIRNATRPMDLAANERLQAIFADREALIWNQIDQIYKHIHQYASNFFGQKYMIKLPFMCSIIDSTNLTIIKNWNLASDGGWFEGSILGLLPGSFILEQFRHDDGRFNAFVGFNITPSSLDFSYINNRDDIVQISSSVAYLRCSVDKMVQVSATDWRAVISLPGQVNVYDPDTEIEHMLGLYAIAKEKYGSVDKSILNALGEMTGGDRLKYDLSPLPQIPSAAAIPLRSNRLTYGPWGATVVDNEDGTADIDWTLPRSTAGKTDYQRDSQFAPWNFGSMTRLNDAGDAYVRTRLSNHYVIEQGSVSVADAPTASMGQALFAGGPIVTQMNVSVGAGAQPVNTTYLMKTYTPNFGALGQQYIAALKRTGQQARKSNRMFRVWALEKYKVFADKVFGHWNQRARDSIRYNTGSSHDILAGNYLVDPDDNTNTQCNVATTELRKHLPEMGGDNPTRYKQQATMDMNGFFRPFSTNPDDLAYMFPTFEDSAAPDERNMTTLSVQSFFYTKEQVPPVWGTEPHLPITIETLSPFLKDGNASNGLDMTGGVASVGHDIEYITRDGVYPTYLSIRRPDDNYSETHWYRGIALRGPLILAGWGFDTNNKPVPNAGGSEGNELAFEKDWLRKPHKWKVGPIDLRWDHRRKVWTSPAPMKIIQVVLAGPLIPGSCAAATISGEDDQYDEVGNPISSSAKVAIYSGISHVIPPGVTVSVYWDTTDEKYVCIDGPDVLYEITITSNVTTSNPTCDVVDSLGITTDMAGESGTVSNDLGQGMYDGQPATALILSATSTATETLPDDTSCVTTASYVFSIVEHNGFDRCNGTLNSAITGSDPTVSVTIIDVTKGESPGSSVTAQNDFDWIADSGAICKVEYNYVSKIWELYQVACSG